ncbi:hypothetical protein HS088_TW06G00135 [Tripterygium wilfordii]|uniref:C2 domain-containing protein n=1 Tax=Tripterygium wilfordii TaxID=458696 RepID=A0A7J7DHX9_TRIWF|nr:uncharacterized protein LOC120000311 [Tripterygium wilfordii]KAF5745970.1 hypothetical protein HS088_TW06G00135 [Tripterygium wilfordii]
METSVLEINLISAQGLKLPSSHLGTQQTYAVAWVDSSTKLRTRVDRVGAENPTWNDQFFFRVTPDFLSSETSGVSVEIYSVGYLRDRLVGTVRFLISNLPRSPLKTPSFSALQIQRPSGRFHGVMNIAAMLISSSDFVSLDGVSAIGYRDLMGKGRRRLSRRDNRRKPSNSLSMDLSGENPHFTADSDSIDSSDGADSTTSSSSTASTALRDWNGVRDLAGTNLMRSSSAACGLSLCGLLCQSKVGFGTLDQNSLKDRN